jgi:dienelactone hydrolase
MRMKTVIGWVAVATLFAARAEGQQMRYDTVTGAGYVAHVHQPSNRVGGAKYPAVLLLGGSGGGIGWQDYMSHMLADRGYLAMSVAYFRMPGLPDELERIPLESIEGALDWLLHQPGVDRTRIGIGSVSKGSELALRIASMHPEIHAVAAFTPSGVAFQSLAPGFPLTSSWSYRGKDVPFVPYGAVPPNATLADRYLAGVRSASPALLDSASTRVEQINGPILMLSGESDNLYGSATLARMVEARLHSHGFKHSVEHIAYPNAGHLISSIRNDSAVIQRGGTFEGNDFAQRDGQRRFLEFFDKVFTKKK